MGRRVSADDVWAAYKKDAASKRPSADDVWSAYQAENATFVDPKVLDADTVRPDGVGRQDVRSLGIDAPEVAHAPGDKDQPGGREAMEARRRRLAGKIMELRGKTVDGHGRDVASIYVDGKPEQIEQVRNGEAMVYMDYLGNVTPEYREKLLQAEEEAKSHKRGIWSIPDFEKPEDWRRRQQLEKFKAGAKVKNPLSAQGKEKDEPETGALNRVLDSLDYLNNVGRSTIYGAVQAPSGHRLEGAAEAAKEAFRKERKISATELRDALNRRLGNGKVRFGRDGDGETTFGDGLDVATDISIDILTDPLTYLSGGLTALGKIPKAAKLAQRASEIAKPAVGAALGFGATNADDPVALRAGAAALGAVAPRIVGKAAGKVAPKIREAFDEAYESYARRTGRVGNAPDEIKEIWKKERSPGKTAATELRDEALARADAEVPAVKSLEEAKARRLAVEKRADEIHAEELGKVRQYITGEAAQNVARRRGVDVAEALEKHADEVNDTARKIADVKLTDMPVTSALRLQKAGLDKVKHITMSVMQGRYKALDGLSDAEKTATTGLMHEGKEFFKAAREELFQKAGFNPEAHMGQGLMERIKGSELSDGELGELVKAYDNEFYKWRDRIADQMIAEGKHPNQVNGFLNRSTDRHLFKVRQFEQGYIPIDETKKAYSILQQGAQRRLNDLTREATRLTEENWEKVALQRQTAKVQQAVSDWKAHNEEVVKKFNDEVLGLRSGRATPDGKGIVGVKWHVDDVYLPEAQAAADEILSVAKQGNVQAARKAGASDAAERLGADQTYGIYARGLAYKFVDAQTKEAMRIAKGYKELLAKHGYQRGWESALKGFDRLQNFAKANMLYFSMSWMKNNYFDNLAKAWIEGGFEALVDSSKVALFRKDLRHDLWKLAGGDFNVAAKTPGLKEAFELGVLDGPAFDALIDKEWLKTINAEDPLYRHYFKTKDEEKAGLLARIAEGWVERLSGTVGRVGSYVEGSARFITFEHTKKMLLTLDEFKNQPRQAAEIAADLTKKTFFDYGDVTELERAVFKRIIPFYAFYSKNLPYWSGALVDPRRVGRVAAFQSVRDNLGEEASLQDEATLSPHIARNNPRHVGKDDKGNDLYVISPSSSLDDAVSMVGEPLEALREKSSPLLKLPYEVGADRDLFSDTNLRPSTSEGGKKFLYSRGFKLVAVQKAAEMLGLPPNALGVYVDHRGNPYATKDSTVLVDKVFGTLWPQSFLEQVSGSTGKVANDKETLLEVLLNRLSPAQLVKVSPEQRRMQRTRKDGRQ